MDNSESQSPARLNPPERWAQAAQGRSTIGTALFGALLMWLALPPCDLWPLAWVAPAPWLLLIRRARLAGRRPYLAIWFAGFVFWLLVVHWLRLPHPALYLGWIALAFYLAFYVPVFVGLSRVAVHRLRLPLWLAAPIVWTALELARAHLLSGFLMAALAHTQLRWTALIQISDLAGGYAVSFVVMLAAACLVECWSLSDKRVHWRAILPAAICLPLALAYGYWRLAEDETDPAGLSPTVALIQGNIAPDWKQNAEKQTQILETYLRMSAEATRDRSDIDLVVWPETMYREPVYTLADDFKANAVPEEFQTSGDPREDAARFATYLKNVTPRRLGFIAQRLGAPLMVGAEAIYLNSWPDEAPKRFNAAVAVDPSGKVLGLYEKTHLVMFGEYVPLADRIPGLYKLTPLQGGLSAGEAPRSIEIGGVRFAPNICYESVIPHLIRRHLRELGERDETPDVLVNLTNDGWYYGSNELDMHLACSVFRAVESRKPVLIAANTGLTASIDAYGRIRDRLPRDKEGFLIAKVEPCRRETIYLRIGDLPAEVCLAVTFVFLTVGVCSRWASRKADLYAQAT